MTMDLVAERKNRKRLDRLEKRLMLRTRKRTHKSYKMDTRKPPASAVGSGQRTRPR